MKELMQRLEDAECDYSDARCALDDVKIEIGEKAREIRKAAGLSLRAVAKKVGVAAPTLYDVELGRRFLSQEKLEKLVKTLSPHHET